MYHKAKKCRIISVIKINLKSLIEIKVNNYFLYFNCFAEDGDFSGDLRLFKYILTFKKIFTLVLNVSIVEI